MPFKKQRRGKFRGKGRKLTKRQKSEVKSLIAVRQEMKYYLNNIPGTSLVTTANIQLLTSIPQGITDQQRAGDKLMLSPRFHLTYNLEAGDIYNFIRVIIFQWKPLAGPSSYIPVATDILLPGSSGGYDFLSHYDHDTRTDFHILYDRVHRMIGNAAAPETPFTDNSTHFVKTTVRIPRRQLQFISGSSTDMSNGIYLLMFSDSIIIPNPTISLAVKFMYTDS